jgi:MinD-like ATPase involved in chromosome partitioning or flagellar assembly
MSKDDAVNNGAYGIPGYTSNNAIPGSFELPLPLPQDAEPEPVPESVDPWATTWDTATWESPSAESPYSASSDTSYASGDSWSSSSYEPPTTTEDSWKVDTSWDTQTDWSTDTTWSSGESQTEEYSGWVPQGASPFGEPGGFTYDHRLAELAHASKPSIDPDVAEAALEVGTDPYSTAYDRDVDFDRPGSGPHADDLITARSRGERQKTKASSGVRRAFGLAPGKKELLERDRIDRIARPLDSRKTIMVINTKGGGGKTLVTLMLASYLGRYRSGSVLAWDNNETEGTLGMRAPSQPHHRTVVDFLAALPTIAANPTAGPSDLQHWVREQRGLSFDILASADDDEAMRIVGEQEFQEVHDQLSRFYRMIVVDTGNNRLSPNWLAAAGAADMLVFATSLKDDTSVVAAKNLDALVSMGRGDLVRNAVCVISHTTVKGNDIGAGVHTREHFEQWVRAVVDIPYDPALAPGLHIDPTKIARKTHESCMEMTATVVDGL